MSEIKRCVTVMIPHDETVNNDEMEFLVLEHVKCKHKFTFPAGTCEPREDEYYTVQREMMEELSLHIKYHDIQRKFRRMAYYDRIDGHRAYLESTFIIRRGDQAITNMEPDKHPSFKWVTIEEIFNNPQEYTYNTWLTAAETLRLEGKLNIADI